MVQENSLVKPKIVVITGPTASGKTGLSINLAKEFNGEIVSADSMQIYKNMNIGTAKVTEEEKDGVMHYCLDIVDETESFSVSDWLNEAKKSINQIIKKGKLPIIVGGTGLYLSSLIYGYDFSGVKPNPRLRNYYTSYLNKFGVDKLYSLLEKKSPTLAKTVDKHNTKIVIRKLEIASSNNVKTNCDEPYDYCLIGIDLPRELLYERINTRVDKMLKDGLIKEFEYLLNRGLKRENQSATAIGYRELFDYVDKKSSLEDTISKIKQHSRNYAKRQVTYLKGMKNIQWVSYLDKEKPSEIISNFLKKKEI